MDEGQEYQKGGEYPRESGFWPFFMQLFNDSRFWMMLVLIVSLIFSFFVITDVLNPAMLAELIGLGYDFVEVEANKGVR